MEIIHDAQNNMFKTNVDGYTAYATYIIKEGKLDIRHTIVPPEIGGRGIAGKLVKATYDYAPATKPATHRHLLLRRRLAAKTSRIPRQSR